MNYLEISKNDIANGPGVRSVLWVAGCDLKCKGCHNPESWDYSAGKLFDDLAMVELLESLDKPWIRGLTITGGNPLAYNNLPDVYEICKTVREKLPDKDIWLYTGYVVSMNQLDTTVDIGWDNGLLSNFILAMCDVVVDGPYVEELRDTTLPFRGSSNQCLIDVKRSIEAGSLFTYNTAECGGII